MTTAQDFAREAYDSLERATRSDGSEYIARKDGAPEWVADLIHESHGDMLPDDWRYECIQDALGAIADADDPDDALAEFADGADIYNSDLLAWVGSHSSRGGYVDEAVAEFGPPRDFYHSLQMGQYMERSEIYGSLLASLRRLADEEEDKD